MNNTKGNPQQKRLFWSKKSRNGDTLGPVELNVGFEQDNQGDQGDRLE